jgi:hypothetical protein
MFTAKRLFIIYLVGAVFTNSYIRTHKWNEWTETSIKNGNSVHKAHDNCAICALFTTVGWPAYAAVSVADIILSTKVTIEKPEILK